MKTTHKPKTAVLDILDCLVTSCEEALDGTWDASPGNGDLGFESMILQLEQVIRYVNNQKD